MKKILFFLFFYSFFCLNAQKKDSSVTIIHKVCTTQGGIYKTYLYGDNTIHKPTDNKLLPSFIYSYYSNFKNQYPDSIFIKQKNKIEKYKVGTIVEDNELMTYQLINKYGKGFIEFSPNNLIRGSYKVKEGQYIWESCIDN